MTSRSTRENALATLAVLPSSDALLDALQKLVDQHYRNMVPSRGIIEPKGAIRPIPPTSSIDLKTALLSGEP